jgi:hypothetical protein
MPQKLNFIVNPSKTGCKAALDFGLQKYGFKASRLQVVRAAALVL